jgi:hypothetical protein
MVEINKKKKRIRKKIVGMEKEVKELKLIERKSEKINKKLRKGMKKIDV